MLWEQQLRAESFRYPARPWLKSLSVPVVGQMLLCGAGQHL